MSGRRIVKGKALRATCPACGRNTAVYADRHALQAGVGLTYLLQPHRGDAPVGKKCNGWRVYKGDLVSDVSGGDRG